MENDDAVIRSGLDDFSDLFLVVGFAGVKKAFYYCESFVGEEGHGFGFRAELGGSELFAFDETDVEVVVVFFSELFTPNTDFFARGISVVAVEEENVFFGGGHLMG